MTVQKINWQNLIIGLSPVLIAILYLYIDSHFATDAEVEIMKEDIIELQTEQRTDDEKEIQVMNTIDDVAKRQEKKIKQLNSLRETQIEILLEQARVGEFIRLTHHNE